MPLDLNSIPRLDEEPASAEPTRALRDIKVSPASRRTVLRGVALSALTVGATALSWSPLAGNRAARAENGPGGLRGWDSNTCADAYPRGYDAEPDTGGSFRNEKAACFGGDFMASTYCASGWHRSGTVRDAPVITTYKPISTACGSGTTKNAWKWKTSDNKVWRCSDGHTTVSAGGTSRTYLTICRARV